MEVAHREHFRLSFGHPLVAVAGRRLKLGAMPVAAGVVGDPQVRAGLAAFDMTAQRRCSAALDRRHDLQLAETHMAGMGGTPNRPAVAEDVRHLDRRP